MKTKIKAAMVFAAGVALLGISQPAFAMSEPDCLLSHGKWINVPGWGWGCALPHRVSTAHAWREPPLYKNRWIPGAHGIPVAAHGLPVITHGLPATAHGLPVLTHGLPVARQAPKTAIFDRWPNKAVPIRGKEAESTTVHREQLGPMPR